MARDIAQKAETICSLTSSTQQSQSVVEEMEAAESDFDQSVIGDAEDSEEVEAGYQDT
jgi:hypothetical protein